MFNKIKPIIISKIWGWEFVYHNNDKYCFKRLLLRKSFQCSTHYHKIKEETFYIEFGKIILNIEGKDNILRQGDYITLLPMTKHSFCGITNAMIIECSSQDFVEDSYRVENELSRQINLEERLKIS